MYLSQAIKPTSVARLAGDRYTKETIGFVNKSVVLVFVLFVELLLGFGGTGGSTIGIYLYSLKEIISKVEKSIFTNASSWNILLLESL
jgi:hypothetical protein